MVSYLILFIIACIVYSTTREDNEKSKLILAIYLGGLALFVGCGDMLGGYDRYIYGEVFDQLSIATRAGGDLSQTAGYRLFGTEWGYLGFNQLMAYVTLNRYVFIFTLTILIYTLLFFSIARYCEDYPFAVILFLGLWFFFTFTYLRQVTAATIGWLAIRYAINRKPILFFAIVTLAFGFHNSALVLAPLYFVPQKIYPKVIILLGLLVCLAIGMSNILGAIVGEADVIVNSARAEENATYLAEGTFRIEYFIEAMLFIGIILWNYDVFDEDDPQQTTLLNMAIVFCAILLVFVRSTNGGRIAWHYMIGLIATITYIAKYTNFTVIRSGLIIMCSLLYLRILIVWGAQIAPYKSFFTNGHRQEDRIYRIYEYDQRYDQDKFYKL